MAVQLILKNSSVADRRPTANQLGNGEISLNFNAAGAFLSCRDTNGDIQQVGGVRVSETAPATPARQTAWVKPSTRTLSIYSGSSWIDIGAVTSVNGQSGVVTLTKANIGLGNVDNTSDLNKPISTATQNALNTKADLVGGKVPTSQLPSLAVSEYLGPAANQAAMLLLSGERGDWCIRTDLSSTFVLISDGGSSIGDWQELATPASPVSSVNGYTGAVVLGAADVGAATTAQGALADSALQPGDNISELTNDENYITSAEVPVQSVNTKTGVVVLDAADVGAVNLTGDNMTGDLTLGTSNIVLNASNGSAEFAGSTYRFGTFDSTNVTSADSGADIRLGTLSLKRNDTDGNPIFKGYSTSGTVISRIYGTGSAEFAGSVSIGGTLPSAPNIELNSSDGSAEFAGDIKVPNAINTVTSNDGIHVYANGQIYASRSGTNSLWTGKQTAVSGYTSRILADGSAEFAGSVEIGGGVIELNSNGKITAVSNILSTNGTQQSFLSPNGFAEFNRIGDGANGAVRINSASKGIVIADQNNTANALLNYDGSAEFASIEVDNLTIDGSTISSTGTLNMVSGATAAINFKSSANNNDYRFYNTAQTFYGSLRFNTLASNRIFNFPNNGGTVALTSDSAWVTGSTSTAGILTLASNLTATFNGDVEIGSDVTIKSSNGNITINGNYQAGGNPASGTADGCRIDSTGTVRAAKTTGNNAIWTGYQVGSALATSRINADGSASYSGTVTATVVPPSDARFKTNITPAKPQLADIVALGGLLKNYNWNDKAPLNEELRSQRQLGLIAQEVAEVCPSITKTIHRTRTVETKPAVTDDESAVVTEAVTKEVDESYQGISQDALIMKLLGAVAELKAEVDALSKLVVVGSD